MRLTMTIAERQHIGNEPINGAKTSTNRNKTKQETADVSWVCPPALSCITLRLNEALDG